MDLAAYFRPANATMFPPKFSWKPHASTLLRIELLHTVMHITNHHHHHPILVASNWVMHITKWLNEFSNWKYRCSKWWSSEYTFFPFSFATLGTQTHATSIPMSLTSRVTAWGRIHIKIWMNFDVENLIKWTVEKRSKKKRKKRNKQYDCVYYKPKQAFSLLPSLISMDYNIVINGRKKKGPKKESQVKTTFQQAHLDHELTLLHIP